ncbi:MAG: hypothetical protein GY869_14060 [Planctomycetes bacterium]|nr:hypothetical protein [Planctomycetota bacterium]
MKRKTLLMVSMMVLLGLSPLCWAQGFGTTITYQGKLNDGGAPANDMYDFSFQLYDAATLGHPINLIPLVREDVNVYQGYFTVNDLDFGATSFNGDARWLQIGVRPFKSTGAYTLLTPRQELTPNPYSLYAAKTAGLDLPYEGAASSSSPVIKLTNTGAGNAIEGRGQNNDGVVGAAFAGNRSGIFGFNDHADGFGVFGSSINGTGVKGYTYGTTGSGGLFEIDNASNSNPALKAVTNSSTGYAGYFEGRGYFSDKVGIGTSSPATNLHLFAGPGGGGSVVDNMDILTMENDDNAYLNIITPPNKIGGILFSDNDRNEGIISYNHNTDSMKFSTDRGTRITINDTGNVGIGDITPDFKLDVNGDINFTGDLYQNDILFDPGSSLWSSNGSDIYYNDGNVGIGTTSPSAPLTITPVSGADIEFTGSVYNADIKSTNQLHIGTTNTTPIHFLTDDFYRLTINGAGDVGIGTTAPTRKLEVRGDSSAYLGFFYNDATGSNSPYGIYANADARDTANQNSHAAVFNSYGGATSGGAYGIQCYAVANGDSPSYGIYVSAKGGPTTGREWAFFGLGDGFFDGNVGIGTAYPDTELDVLGTIRMKDGNQADGKLMVSDADGNAAWKDGRKYTVSGTLNSSLPTLTNTWTKIKDYLTFTKDNAATDIEVTMNTRIRGGTFVGATGVMFEIRIDDNSTTLDNKGSIIVSNSQEFNSLIAVFQGLSAGNHTVSIWAKTNSGTSNGIIIDPGGYGGKILVKEVW